MDRWHSGLCAITAYGGSACTCLDLESRIDMDLDWDDGEPLLGVTLNGLPVCSEDYR